MGSCALFGNRARDGLPRVVHGTVDMGAYDYRGPLGGVCLVR